MLQPSTLDALRAKLQELGFRKNPFDAAQLVEGREWWNLSRIESSTTTIIGVGLPVKSTRAKRDKIYVVDWELIDKNDEWCGCHCEPTVEALSAALVDLIL